MHKTHYVSSTRSRDFINVVKQIGESYKGSIMANIRARAD
jgi:hypothetical protein